LANTQTSTAISSPPSEIKFLDISNFWRQQRPTQAERELLQMSRGLGVQPPVFSFGNVALRRIYRLIFDGYGFQQENHLRRMTGNQLLTK
jgi:hypothetical protein